MSHAPAQPAPGTVDPSTHVADLVSAVPARAAVFERHGIEYCCGGKLPLHEACAALGLDLAMVVDELEQAGRTVADEPDWTTASIPELVTNIVDTHHAFLRVELPRLVELAGKVARAHGITNPKLVEARSQVDRLVADLVAHLESEELDVFPRCIELADGADVDVAELIHELEHDHDEVADHLVRMRDLLDDYEVPAGACTSYRAYLDTMQRIERDIHRHVHKENHILFGKVMQLVGDVPASA